MTFPSLSYPMFNFVSPVSVLSKLDLIGRWAITKQRNTTETLVRLLFN